MPLNLQPCAEGKPSRELASCVMAIPQLMLVAHEGAGPTLRLQLIGAVREPLYVVMRHGPE